jgi:hypothetical protein
MRDDFPAAVKSKLAQRVRHTCSNPGCSAPTAGPREDRHGAVNIGVAGHISGASPGGPRYNPNLTPEQRRDISNGIWLCQTCGKLIDSDEPRFTEGLLRAWKTLAEEHARLSLGKTAAAYAAEKMPFLELYLELDGEEIQPDYHSQAPVRRFVLGLHNTGKAIAKFPFIRFSFSAGLSLDQFGIDGNIGYGLTPSQLEQGWAGFHGGGDRVIHACQLLKITKLFQRGEDKEDFGISAIQYPNLYLHGRPTHHRWVFKPIHFTCEISAEGIPTVTQPKRISPPAR